MPSATTTPSTRTVLTTPPPPPPAAPTHDFLASAAEAHAAHGYDWPQVLDSYFTGAYVFKGPDYFMLAHEDPAQDAWVVWWAECYPRRGPAEMLRLFLRHAPYYRAHIIWARNLKGTGPRKYSTERLIRFTKP